MDRTGGRGNGGFAEIAAAEKVQAEIAQAEKVLAEKVAVEKAQAEITRHQKKPEETPSTANVNIGDAKNEAPMEAKDKSDGDGK